MSKRKLQVERVRLYDPESIDRASLVVTFNRDLTALEVLGIRTAIMEALS